MMRKMRRLLSMMLIGVYASTLLAADNNMDKVQGQLLQSQQPPATAPVQPLAASAPAPATPVASPAQPAALVPMQMPQPAPAGQPAAATTAHQPNSPQAVPLMPKAANPVGGSDINNQAFGQMINKVLPLSPDQIRALRVLFDQSQRAATARPIAVEPKPVISTQIVNFSPGSTPPFVRLAMGSVSSLVFVDSTGAKWPIASYAVPGAGKIYDVKCVDCGETKDKQGNILLITPLVAHPDPAQGSNITVILQGLDTPISVKLFSDQPVIDYRADLHIPKIGPYALPTLSTLPDKPSAVLTNVLGGIPPNGSKAVKVIGCDCQAWLLNNRLYLRTTLPVLSPGYIARISSADGMNAYELPQVPVILASRHGETVTLSVEGF